MAPSVTLMARASGASWMSGWVSSTSQKRRKPAMAFWKVSVKSRMEVIGAVNSEM